MEPFEIMVSESQERMLCVVEPGTVAAVMGVCERWEILCTPIGSITAAVDGVGSFRILKHGETIGELPVPLLVDDCPLYDLAPEAPTTALYGAGRAVLAEGEAEADAGAALLALLSCANIASRRPVFEQYDPVVQSRTVRRPEQTDAAVLVLENGAGIAISIDGNGRRVAVDPRAGAAEAVYECAANLACCGAERSVSPTASTSATPRSRTSPGS